MPPPPHEATSIADARSDDDNWTLADVIEKKQKENPGPSLLRRKVYHTDSVE